MRRLAQFVRLRASVCLASCLASVSRLSASVHVKGSECVRLASVVLSRVSRLSVSRLVSRLSRVCLRLFTSRVPNACVSRLSSCLASRVCLSRVLSRVCLASVCVCSRQGFRMRASRVCRLVSRLASVSRLVSRLSRVLCVGRLVSRLSVCLRLRLASVSRRSSCLASVCLLVNACGVWLILCRSSFKEFKRFLLSSYYRCTYRLCRLYEQTFNILI